MKNKESYSIFRNGEEVFSQLTQGEYFERMQDYAIEFYQTGHPTQDELKTEVIGANEWQKQKQDS